jgi:hypothetical protein
MNRFNKFGLLCFSLLLYFFLAACASSVNKEEVPLKETIMRYNILLAEGYRTMNMNPLQEVATKEQAEKLYFHMAAIGEGRLRLDSKLKNIKFTKFETGKADLASVETKEVWDYAHIDINTNSKFAEERDFVYEMGYSLKKRDGRWIVTNVVTIGGTSTNTVIPWPKIDRKGQTMNPTKSTDGIEKPSGHN